MSLKYNLNTLLHNINERKNNKIEKKRRFVEIQNNKLINRIYLADKFGFRKIIFGKFPVFQRVLEN